jgi:hypothetical protein
MTCRNCGDIGMIRVSWSNAPDDFAVCLCAAGRSMRNTTNRKDTGFALWQVWAAREQIDPSRVFLVEEVLTPQELAARGFSVTARPTLVTREAALLASAKRPVKL